MLGLDAKVFLCLPWTSSSAHVLLNYRPQSRNVFRLRNDCSALKTLVLWGLKREMAFSRSTLFQLWGVQAWCLISRKTLLMYCCSLNRIDVIAHCMHMEAWTSHLSPVQEKAIRRKSFDRQQSINKGGMWCENRCARWRFSRDGV